MGADTVRIIQTACNYATKLTIRNAETALEGEVPKSDWKFQNNCMGPQADSKAREAMYQVLVPGINYHNLLNLALNI